MTTLSNTPISYTRPPLWRRGTHTGALLTPQVHVSTGVGQVIQRQELRRQWAQQQCPESTQRAAALCPGTLTSSSTCREALELASLLAPSSCAESCLACLRENQRAGVRRLQGSLSWPLGIHRPPPPSSHLQDSPLARDEIEGLVDQRVQVFNLEAGSRR